ncbi:hypothetical protein B0H14DRAFT_2843985 [Mycena olivaceomarginata]|nr:hypothetical protein B0H14DRAFT_2843985 [Mycena olivaceomarginata]
MRRRRVSSAPVWGLSALAHQVCYSSPRATSSCNCTTAPNRVVFAPWQPTTRGHGTLSGALAAAQTRFGSRGNITPTHPRQRRKPGVWARRRPTTVRDNVPQACNKEAGTYFVPRMSASEVLACCSSQDFMPTMILHANGHVARPRVPSGCIGLVKNIVVGFPRDTSDIWSSQTKYKETTARDGRVVGKMMRSETSVR